MLAKIVNFFAARTAQVVALVNALFGALVVFNVALTADQQGAVIVLVNAVLAFLAAPSVKAAIVKRANA